jgi:hypothetical protein
MKLKDCLPYEAYDFPNVNKYADLEVVEKHQSFNKRWIGKHKNVHVWFVLENGYAIGWNENPAIGWGFPVERYKK